MASRRSQLWPVDRRTLLRILVPSLALAVLSWYFGVDVVHAVLLGVAVTVAQIAVRSVSGEVDDRDVDWRPEERVNRLGSRDDITNLTWSMATSWGMVGRAGEIRLRQIARRRLALEGLDLQDPADHAEIERRLGTAAARILVRENILGLRIKTLLGVLDALDMLDPTYYPPPQLSARRGRRNLTAPRQKGTS